MRIMKSPYQRDYAELTPREEELIATAKKLYPLAENDYIAVDLYCQRINVEARAIQEDQTKKEEYYTLCKTYRELRDIMKSMPLPESYRRYLPIINEKEVRANATA